MTLYRDDTAVQRFVHYLKKDDRLQRYRFLIGFGPALWTDLIYRDLDQRNNKYLPLHESARLRFSYFEKWLGDPPGLYHPSDVVAIPPSFAMHYALCDCEATITLAKMRDLPVLDLLSKTDP